MGCQGRIDVEFQSEVKTIIHIITENRNRCARGPVDNPGIVRVPADVDLVDLASRGG